MKNFVLRVVVVSLIVASSVQATEMFYYQNSYLVSISARLTFFDEARGGQLYVVNNSSRVPGEVMLSTRRGQSSSEVRSNLKDVILKDALGRLMPSRTTGQKTELDQEYYQRTWQESGHIVLEGSVGEVVIGGTETGLGIAPPVGSVSAYYDNGKDELKLRWFDSGGYDEVYVRLLGKQWGRRSSDVGGAGEGFPWFVIPGEFDRRHAGRAYYVVGFKNGLPTNASYVIADSNQQVDSFFHPFTNNITTNWTGWSSVAASVKFEEKPFSQEWAAPPVESGKSYPNRSAQIISSDNADGQGGLYRSFIAQAQGNTYRPSIRYRVMEEAEDFEGEWSFDIMVGAIEFIRSYELDEATRIRQADAWSELESSASQVRKWHFDQSMANSGEWVVRDTGAADSQNPQKDITLDEEKTAIFICVRLTGHKPNGIAMDSVRLVDVTRDTAQ